MAAQIIILFVVSLLGALAAFFAFSVYNKINEMQKEAKTAFTLLDVALRFRQDAVINIAAASDPQAGETKALAERAVTLKKHSHGDVSMAQRIEMEKEITSIANRVLELPAQEPPGGRSSVLKQQRSLLKKFERNAARGEERYNAAVRNFNTLLGTFPFNLFRLFMELKEKDLFVFEPTSLTREELVQ